MSATPGKLNKVTAIKRYFEQDDKLSPGGGKKVGTPEMAALGNDGRQELAVLAAKELGVDLE